MNWIYNNKEITDVSQFPPQAIGFIYRIDNETLGKWYYGRKTCRALGKKKKLTLKEKQLPENKRKTFKHVEHEYKGWQSYTGSCIELNNDIKNGHKITKTIVEFCYSKKQMGALEIKYIVCNGITEDLCYNGNILGRFFKNEFKSGK